jgi:hypothetical protein
MACPFATFASFNVSAKAISTSINPPDTAPLQLLATRPQPLLLELLDQPGRPVFRLEGQGR